MALEHLSRERREREMVRQKLAEQAEEQKRFQDVLVEGRKAQWWKDFIKCITVRRERLVDELTVGVQEQRFEDRIRGQISELNFILSLDRIPFPDTQTRENVDENAGSDENR